MSNLSNIIPTRGVRQHFNFDIDDEGQLVSQGDDDRQVLVLYNLGPDAVWGNKTLLSATPDEGTPILAGGALIDDNSSDSWYFATATGEEADIRGWEVIRP